MMGASGNRYPASSAALASNGAMLQATRLSPGNTPVRLAATVFSATGYYYAP
jgi:hypothetical protein